MNNTSCPSVNFDFTGKFLPPVYILVFIIGLVANGLGLKSLLHNWKKLGIVNVFVLNLGLADILYLLTLPFLMVYYFKKSKWIFGATFCKITRFCFNLNLYGSIGFLTCISVYRYLAIVHPMRVMGRITVTHSVAISVMVWLLVSIQSTPDMFYPKTFGNSTGKCYDTTNNNNAKDYLKYSFGWTLTGFCIPLLITLGCYGHVIVVICRTNSTDKVLKYSFGRTLTGFCIPLLITLGCYGHVIVVLCRTNSTDKVLKYSFGWTLTGFCVPLLITLGCYGHVIVVLCRTNTTDKVLKQRSLKLLFILILLFSVCYIPHYVFKNLNLLVRVLSKQGICHEWFNRIYIAHQISRGLVCLNSALNPLVYLH